MLIIIECNINDNNSTKEGRGNGRYTRIKFLYFTGVNLVLPQSSFDKTYTAIPRTIAKIF